MNIFITGGAGFIGSNFIRYLLSSDPSSRVVNFDKLTYAGNLANLQDVSGSPNYRFVKGDICDAPAVADAMCGCDAIVHFAAESHVDRSIYEPMRAIETNITGTFTLLQVARDLKIGRFIHVSTDEVYGDLPPGSAADESFPLRPSSPYSASKASSDLLVGSFVRTFGFPAIITRASNNYGRNQFPEKFLPLMITSALNERSLPVYGDGLQERVVENLTMVRHVLALLGKSESLITYITDRPGHDRRYALDCGKMFTELGWQPQVSLEEGLRRTIEWYRANDEWLAAVRGGEYRNYFEKYYENRDSSLRALTSAGNVPTT